MSRTPPRNWEHDREVTMKAIGKALRKMRHTIDVEGPYQVWRYATGCFRVLIENPAAVRERETEKVREQIRAREIARKDRIRDLEQIHVVTGHVPGFPDETEYDMAIFADGMPAPIASAVPVVAVVAPISFEPAAEVAQGEAPGVPNIPDPVIPSNTDAEAALREKRHPAAGKAAATRRARRAA
jgi:hypothetical protein